MDKVTLYINGTAVQAQKGATVLEAALSAGIDIPRLCFHSALPPQSSCRLCVVEVKGARGLIASCSLPAAQDMAVTTNSEKLFKYRKYILELILSNHPMDCMTCEKSGECELQEYAYKFGIKQTPIRGEVTNYPIEATDPLMMIEHSKCILCGRCVSVCRDLWATEAIDFSKRGFSSKISFPFDKPRLESDCVFCGNCITFCPTGAITERSALGKGRSWEVKKIPSVCPFCGCGCNIEINTKAGKIVKITSNENTPVNKGLLCVKGKFGYDFVHHPDRIGKPSACSTDPSADSASFVQQPCGENGHPCYPSTSLHENLIKSSERLSRPMVKKGGKFHEVSWDEAMNVVSGRLLEMKQKYGAEALGVLCSAKCTNEENDLMQKLARTLLGTNNVDHCARLCHSSTVAGMVQSFGGAAMTNSIEEIEKASCLFVIGSNPTENHPIIGAIIARTAMKGAKLIVADPRAIHLTKFASAWLRHKCGTDVALINGLLNVIVKEGLQNNEFINARTENYEDFRNSIEKYTPEYVSGITGVPKEEIIKAARIYASSKNAMIFFAMGITQHTTGTDNVLSVCNLALLTGNVGKEAAGVCPLRGQNNVQGACDVGALPDFYPGYQKVNDPNARGKFGKAWGIPLDNKIGYTLTEMVNFAAQDKIKALYIMGENPMMSDPDLLHADEAFKKLEFMVVQDIFMTETAQLADVVLPATTFAEKEGTVTNTERRVQLMRRAIQPWGDSKPDWQIICMLGKKLSSVLRRNEPAFGNVYFDYDSPAEIMDEIASLSPVYGGISYDRLGKIGLQWPCPDKNHPGTKFLHKDRFSRGQGRFNVVEFRPPAESADNEYPFTLTTGRVLYHLHGGSMTRRSTGLDFILHEGYVEVNPEDAERLGFQHGQHVNVTSRRGTIKIKANVTDKVPPGTVFIPFHFAECAANILTNNALDPVSKIPEYKVCAVRIEV
ncbi:MAG: formate dehydrogenase subunit alpha [Planctomycetes bacterium]|nr:formate dehydrogenase subunit alpha [Planctomycetota bacterium]